MRDRLPGTGGAGLNSTADPWTRFERALARHLRRPGSVGAMEFAAPPDSTGAQARCTAQFAGDGSLAWVTFRPTRSLLTEEMVVHASSPDPAQIARAVAETTRDRLGVPDPQLLTLRCQGSVCHGVETLGLTRSGAVPFGDDPADYPNPIDVAVEVVDHDDVRERFTTIVERITGSVTIIDDSGDLVFDHVGHPIHVSFDSVDGIPSARIWTWIVHGVHSRALSAVELARLNRDEEWTTWILDGRHVMQRSTLAVAPFLPRHIQFHLERYLYTFAGTRDAIAARLGPPLRR